MKAVLQISKGAFEPVLGLPLRHRDWAAILTSSSPLSDLWRAIASTRIVPSD